ncbi:MAG: hypothetical protein A4E32_00209 [Methanomassiliicoccales archaeon PtaU1.Bin124]|nr:MAG: hypothetical protein A4E32_00209 [Methanomassiliicoccales archaeon PtaU1.Bin124]
MDYNAALRLSREVRKDLGDMLADLRGREFFDVATDVGEAAKGGWAFDRMDQELKLLERYILDNDFDSISRREWSTCQLLNFYDHLLDVVHKHPKREHQSKLVDDIKGWRKRAGELAQMVCQMEDND